METPLKILHLEYNLNDAELIRESLIAGGMPVEVVYAGTRAEFVNALGQAPYDLILADYTLPSFDGLTALSRVREKFPHLPSFLSQARWAKRRQLKPLSEGLRIMY